MAPAAYAAWRDAAKSFEGMVAYGNQDLALISSGETTQERIASVSAGFWSMTGARPVLGRLLMPGETKALVLSHALFERRFAGDPQILGKTVKLKGYLFTVVGVLPEDYQFLFPQQWISGDERRPIDGYIPLREGALRLWLVHASDEEALTEQLGPVPWNVCVMGKLKPGVSLVGARAEMETIYRRVKKEHYPDWPSGIRLDYAPLKEELVRNARSALMVLVGAVGFVLLIASVNVANLLLARNSTRRK